MSMVFSAEFLASFSHYYKFIMRNYVQFGTIASFCLGEALWTEIQKRLNYFSCLEATEFLGQEHIMDIRQCC